MSTYHVIIILHAEGQSAVSLPLKLAVVGNTGGKNWRETLAGNTGGKNWRETLAAAVELMGCAGHLC